MPPLFITKMCQRQIKVGLKIERNVQKWWYSMQIQVILKRCIVQLYKLYNSKCPSNRSDGAFYLCPREKPTGDVWYTAVAIGHNSLGNTVKRLCKMLVFKVISRIIPFVPVQQLGCLKLEWTSSLSCFELDIVPPVEFDRTNELVRSYIQ